MSYLECNGLDRLVLHCCLYFEDQEPPQARAIEKGLLLRRVFRELRVGGGGVLDDNVREATDDLVSKGLLACENAHLSLTAEGCAALGRGKDGEAVSAVSADSAIERRTGAGAVKAVFNVLKSVHQGSGKLGSPYELDPRVNRDGEVLRGDLAEWVGWQGVEDEECTSAVRHLVRMGLVRVCRVDLHGMKELISISSAGAKLSLSDLTSSLACYSDTSVPTVDEVKAVALSFMQPFEENIQARVERIPQEWVRCEMREILCALKQPHHGTTLNLLMGFLKSVFPSDVQGPPFGKTVFERFEETVPEEIAVALRRDLLTAGEEKAKGCELAQYFAAVRFPSRGMIVSAVVDLLEKGEIYFSGFRPLESKLGISGPVVRIAKKRPQERTSVDAPETISQSEGVGEPRRASGSKRQAGRPVAIDPAEDVKIYNDWKASGITQKEFEHARVLQHRAIAKARDRMQKRSKRKPE